MSSWIVFILFSLLVYFMKFGKIYVYFFVIFRFILLVCDGFFKVFILEEVVNFILFCFEVRNFLGSVSFSCILGFRELEF